MTTATS